MKTVKCRIALAVTTEGEWEAKGTGVDNTYHHELLHDEALAGAACYWVEVEVPVPEIRTITAKYDEEEDWGPLPDAMIELRDRAIDAHRAGETEEFTEMGE